MAKSTYKKSDKSTTNRKPSGNMKGKQGSKDSKSKRVNFDNERESKFQADVDKAVKNIENSFSWYNRNPELIKSASSIGFSVTTGTATTISGMSYTVPGVMAISYHSALGDPQAINQIKDSLYSYTVHANSRNTSYTAEDQFMFVFAGKEVFNAIAHLIRAYGVMRDYDGANFYRPNVLLRAMGFEAEDLRANFNHMLFDINNLIAQSHQIWIPNTMPILERQFWMNSHVYMDADNVKGQMYLYVPDAFYKLSETDEDTGTSLVYTAGPSWALNGTGMKWSTAVAFVQELIDALINSEDRGVIFGDILKAFGPEKIYTINEIDLNYTVKPVYDREVLSQMSNAMAIQGGNTMNIVQANQIIGYDLNSNSAAVTATAVAPGRCCPIQFPINLHVAGQPSIEEITIATRMMVSGGTSYTSSGSNYIRVDTTGSEIATSYQFYTVDLTSTAGYSRVVAYTYVNPGDLPATLALWTAFDWAPTLLYYPVATTSLTIPGSTNIQATQLFQDMDNYCVITNAELKNMHRACLMSLWGVPINLG